MIMMMVVMLALAITSCSSRPKVTRVDAQTQIDLSGYWNDIDVRRVSEALIRDFLHSPRAAQAIADMGRRPVVLVGSFRNLSSEHIDTGIISTTMETVIFNTGRLDFVAGGVVREELRAERQGEIATELGADFMMFGTVRSIVDRAGRHSTRTYFVSAEMTHLATGQRMWMAENNEIKKTVVQRRNRL
jgi:hypothetical protein